MKISVSEDALVSANVDLLVVGVTQTALAKQEVIKTLDRATSDAVSKWAAQENFKGRTGETTVVGGRGKLKAKRVMLVGLGDGTLDEAALRLMGVKAANYAGPRLESIGVLPPNTEHPTVRAIAEGLGLGAYAYTRYLTGDRKPKRALKRAFVLTGKNSAKAFKDTLHAAEVLVDAINLARDLVNAPPNDLTPTALADAAVKAVEDHGVECQVFDKKEIKERGMHMFLAVNQGSTEEPRFVHMSYKPEGAKKRIVFVGKGLTFDSGGLCIKPANGMVDMKCDMAGAATTIGVIMAAARLKLPIEVHGIIACTENMPDGSAYRPGDVFPTLDGKTVEIINTDAEGRLVLADALAYARELKPDYMIDHATLTGACIVALGPWTAAFYANDDTLASSYLDAAKSGGESMWRMPLEEDLREGLKSDIADLKHTGERWGGSIVGALFLREFIGKTKWAHIDIAGPAFLDRAHGTMPKGGTGYGVIAGVKFLQNLIA